MRIKAKSGLEGGAWIDGYDYPNKDKTFHYVRFFKSRVISHLVITAILDVIMNILQR